MYFGRILTVMLLTASVCLSAGESSVEELIPVLKQNMKDTHSLNAKFLQKRNLAVMQHELVIRGELSLDKGGRLAWRVLSPIRYSCIIDGSKLIQWDEDSNQVMTIRTDKNPALKILAASMRNYFSGDFDAMSEDFEIRRGPGKKELLLVPRNGVAVTQFLRSISFYPSEDLKSIRRIFFTERNGDTTEITFHDIQINQPIPESKWQPKQN